MKGSALVDGQCHAPPLDIGRMIDEGEWTTFQKWVLCLASVAYIVDSLANNILGISIPAMMRDWHVVRPAFSSVVAMGWVGVAVGTIVAGSLADKFGRKTLLLASIVIFGAATAGGALVENLHQLLILRIVDGFGIGGAIPTATALLAEFTPTRRRGRAVNIGMLSMPLGTFIGGMIGSIVLPHFGWRALFAINGSIAILVAVLLSICLPESPRYLVRKPHRRAELLRVLRRLRLAVPGASQWVDGSSARIEGPLSALFGREFRMVTVALWGAFFFNFLASYTSLNWMPSLLASHGFGLGVTSSALTAAGIGGILGSVLMAKLVESMGSRVAFIIVTMLAVVSAVTLDQVPLDPTRNPFALLAAIAGLSLSLGSFTGCIYALAAYVYPPAVKGTGVGSAGAVGRLGAIMSSYAAVAALAVGSQAYFAFIAASAVIALSFMVTIKSHIPKDLIFERGATAVFNRKTDRMSQASRDSAG